MFETLYLHIGWSKTGTSAIQYQLDLQKNMLKQQSILYSSVLQMNDQAHHHFALAFSPIHGYPAKFKVAEVLDIIEKEMIAESCSSTLISSELSPFYFNNPRFKQWVSKFKKVVVISTVRRQSDVLISLFNQLVKDPQVRYQGTFFQMAMNNLPKLNYYLQMSRWEKEVGKNNIWIVSYGDTVVEDFLRLFNLTLKSNDLNVVVNPSLPTNALLLMQERTTDVDQPSKYLSIRDELIEEVNVKVLTSKPNRIFLTAGDLRSIDNYFKVSNTKLEEEFLFGGMLFSEKKYEDILVY